MVTRFLVIFIYLFVVYAQIWEQEVKFTASKITKVTLPSNANVSFGGFQEPNPTVTNSENEPNLAAEGNEVAGDESDAPVSPFSKAFFDLIQKMNTSWQTAQNFDESLDGEYLVSLTGLHANFSSYNPPLPKKYDHQNGQIPEEFDARQQWPKCPTIQEIRDQGSCGSCWAISTAEVMSDRICILSNASQKFHYSVEDILSCCTTCGEGCNGGYPGAALNYWKDNGVVSGGEYGSKGPEGGCKPYTIEPCEHHGKNSTSSKRQCSKGVDTPKCSKNCIDGYNVTYQQDLRFGESAYSIENKVETIQREIFYNGPVIAAFDVYEDFLDYGDGVYQHVHGKKVGGHAVKLLGWGVDQASKLEYWLCANSWNTEWGKLGGFFKIKRGTNECDIESNITAGKPKLNRNTRNQQKQATTRPTTQIT